MTEKNESGHEEQNASCSSDKKDSDEAQTADLKEAVKVVTDTKAPAADKKDAHSLLDDTAHEAKKAESFKPAKPEKDVKAD